MELINEWIYARRSRIHGTGVFARRRIPRNTRVVEYVGERIDKDESHRRCSDGNVYIFSINNRVDLDGSVDWNPARWINHSCQPNCRSDISVRGRVWIFSNRVIQPDEEIAYDYNYDLEFFRDYPCRCGSKKCRGYIISADLYPEALKELATNP